jgi:hypothetical protein
LALLIEGKIRASTLKACHFEASEGSLHFVFDALRIANSWWEWHFVFHPNPVCLSFLLSIIISLDNMRHSVICTAFLLKVVLAC